MTQLPFPLTPTPTPEAEETGRKLGKVAQPLRAALTGSTVSPPVFDVMAVLGEEESIARIADHAAHS